MPASTSVPPRFNCAAIRRRSASSNVEIKFAQTKSYCFAACIGSFATSPRVMLQFFMNPVRAGVGAGDPDRLGITIEGVHG